MPPVERCQWHFSTSIKMPPCEIKSDIKNHFKNSISVRFPVVHLYMQSAYHHTATFYRYQLLMLFLHVLTHLAFPAAVSKMASSSVDAQQISYLTWVKKIPEKEAMSIHEVGLRLQMFDLAMEIVSIQYLTKNHH